MSNQIPYEIRVLDLSEKYGQPSFEAYCVGVPDSLRHFFHAYGESPEEAKELLEFIYTDLEDWHIENMGPLPVALRYQVGPQAAPTNFSGGCFREAAEA